MNSHLMKNVSNQQVQKIEEYMPTLHAYCRFLTKSSWDGEDIAQETVLKAIEKYGQSPEVISSALLKRIAYNHWIDTVRKRSKETLESVIDTNRIKNDFHSLNSMEIVQCLMKQFTPKQAVILFLKEAFGYRSSEIAEILETTETAVKAILHRSKKRIGKIGENRPQLIWENEDEQLLSELFFDSLTKQDPTILIRHIPAIHSLMKEKVTPIPSKTHSPLSGLCMAA